MLRCYFGDLGIQQYPYMVCYIIGAYYDEMLCCVFVHFIYENHTATDGTRGADITERTS